MLCRHHPHHASTRGTLAARRRRRALPRMAAPPAFAALVALVALALAAPAAAAPAAADTAPASDAARDAAVSVVLVVDGSAATRSRDAVAATTARALAAEGWQRVSARDAAHRGAAPARLATCDDAACRRALLAAAGIDRALALTVDRADAAGDDPQRFVITARLFDRASGARVATERRYCEGCADTDTLEATVAPLVRALLQADAARAATATTLTVRSTPSGAEVRIDGARVGVTDIDYGVYPGRHEVSLRLAGYRRVTRAITLTPGEARVIQIDLVERPPDLHRLRPWSYAAVAAGAASILAGGVLVAIDRDQVADRRERSTFRDSRTPGLALAGAGAALVTTGVVLWLLDRPEETDSGAHATEPSVAGAVTPTSGGATFSLTGTF